MVVVSTAAAATASALSAGSVIPLQVFTQFWKMCSYAFESSVLLGSAFAAVLRVDWNWLSSVSSNSIL